MEYKKLVRTSTVREKCGWTENFGKYDYSGDFPIGKDYWEFNVCEISENEFKEE